MAPLFKHLIATTITGLMATSAMAADGTINFSGEIIAASCSATAGAGSTVGGEVGKQVIDVPLGKVSMDTLEGSESGSIAAGAAININLDCGNTATGLTTVKVKFDPNSGSGVDLSNNNLLRTTGLAKGVGIGLYDSSSTMINLAGNGTFDAPLIKTGEGEDAKFTAELNLRASYVANGEDLVPGTANGNLPFTLTYE